MYLHQPLLLLMAVVVASYARQDTSEDDGVEKRVVGGRFSNWHEHPYQAALHNGRSYNCGGSLIHQQWVLTAAHCVQGLNRVGVLLGTNRIDFPGPTQHWQQTDQIRIHPNYQARGLRNDIALLRLPRPAPLGRNIQTIGLPRDDGAPGRHLNQEAILSGWGASQGGARMESWLKTGRLPVITNQQCGRTYRPGVVANNNFCAGAHPRTGDSSCFGDSGGPLARRNQDGSFTQLGISSFVTQNCAWGAPAGFTNVGSHLNWINQNVNGQRPWGRGR